MTLGSITALTITVYGLENFAAFLLIQGVDINEKGCFSFVSGLIYVCVVIVHFSGTNLVCSTTTTDVTAIYVFDNS
jgi:hypothetical protein